ncbi:hypothetical protein [Mesorhizobium loti]|uniref:DUF2784 domain-containing protein n=1 Tax=Mesorhizobium loti R88b TaxID=935548 RepID=A0A6M7WX30_RHILI|nr:hypothetical protein [Mesorhizobium loti]QKD05189.1 hypothetical protein EB235_29960 [Mesorhizobium loti R88b]
MNAPVQNPPASAARLVTIKAIHTVVWVFFVACILAIWLFALRGDFFHAALSIGVVLVEVLVLVLNGWQCPLTSVAAGYTGDRRDNFDIYLPEWLARHNKLIFGTLYVAGIAATLARWSNAST